MMQEVQETWKQIREFPNYEISNLGRIYNSVKMVFMKTSVNNYGHVRVMLTSEWTPDRYTRSVAKIVAEHFVEKHSPDFDQVVILDGNLSNVAFYNLAWRPEWFAWKYARQMRTEQPRHFQNLRVRNVVTDVVYDSIIDAGIAEGLLFEYIWESTYTESRVFPNGSQFEVIERV